MKKEVYVAIETGEVAGPNMTRRQEAKIENRLVKNIDRAVRSVYAEPEVIAVELLDETHCQWVYELGMKIETDLPGTVRVFADQSWGHDDENGAEIASGSTLAELGQYLSKHELN